MNPMRNSTLEQMTERSHAQSCSGSCHCGAVRFAVELDLAAPTRRCNCSHCRKTRFWKAIVAPRGFHLLCDSAALSEYRFGDGHAGHCFCRHCGTQVFARIEPDHAGCDAYMINVACLDHGLPAALAAAPLRYEDGRHDNWWEVPAETAHL